MQTKLYHGLGKVGAIATRGLSLVSTSGGEDLQLKYLIVLFNLGMWFFFSRAMAQQVPVFQVVSHTLGSSGW